MLRTQTIAALRSNSRHVSLDEWLTHVPPALVMQHLNISRETLDAIPKPNMAVLPA